MTKLGILRITKLWKINFIVNLPVHTIWLQMKRSTTDALGLFKCHDSYIFVFLQVLSHILVSVYSLQGRSEEDSAKIVRLGPSSATFTLVLTQALCNRRKTNFFPPFFFFLFDSEKGKGKEKGEKM